MLLKEPDNVSPCILLSIVSKSWKTFNPSQIIKDLKPLELLENQIRELDLLLFFIFYCGTFLVVISQYESQLLEVIHQKISRRERERGRERVFLYLFPWSLLNYPLI